MVIAHNLAAMNTQRQSNTVGFQKKKSTERLSSGYKINRAADDAAGLAISEKMRKQIRGLTQASDNCQDGVSYVQVADGALNEVHDMLQRMNVLSVKAANGTNSSSDRIAINDEVQQLKCEIARVFATTEFNEKKIWEPDDKVALEPTVIVTPVTEPVVTYSQKYSTFRIDDTNKAVAPKDSRFYFSADEDGMTISWTGYDGNTYESNKIEWPQNIAGKHTIKLSENMDYSKYPSAVGVDFEFNYNVNSHAPMADVVSAIDSVELYAIESSYENLTFYNADGTRSNIISGGFYLNYEEELVSGKSFTVNDDTFVDGETLYNPVAAGKDDENFSFTFNIANIGSVHTEFNGADFSGSSSDPAGNGLWWRSHPDGSKSVIFHHASPDDSSLNAIYDSIDDSGKEGDSLWYNNKYGGLYYFSLAIKSDNSYTGADGNTKPAGSVVGYIQCNVSVSKSAYKSPDDLKNAIKESLSKVSSYILDDKSGNGTTFEVREYKGQSTQEVTRDIKTITPNYLYLDQDTKNINIQAGCENEKDNIIDINYDSLNIDKLGLTNTNTLTERSSTDAIDEIASALLIVSDQRSYFGAVQNRMEHTIKNLDNVVENTQDAESLIRDTDMAREMVEFSKSNILEQAITSMMSQANQSNQGVLSLIQ